jgi:phosphoribosyl 1,2-cyclic phosphodiesterase/CheY-like chemotaxis protein
VSGPVQKKILVADDVRSIAHSLAGVLRSGGYEVEVALDGEDCLARVESFRPDLVILDLLMPKANGIDVLKRLRATPEHAGLGVIVHSTKDFTTELRIARELGAAGTLNKPASRDEILGRVGAFFGTGSYEASAETGATSATEVPFFRPVLENGRGLLRFWGTRGSFPVCGGRFLRHGGYTTCLGFESEAGAIVFDAGSGVRELGIDLAAQGCDDIHLFITHTHWDHIQGIPSFAPFYRAGTKITIYGDRGFGVDLESLISGQFTTSYFPVNWDEIHADVAFRYLGDDPVVVGGATVSREYANHPGAAVAYRVDFRGASVVFMPDNEFLQGYQGPPGLANVGAELLAPYEKIVRFASGADVLVSEAQFLNEEYADRVGWGHSSLSNACFLTSLARPKRWVVTHHDPSHDDEFLDDKLALTRKILRDLGCDSVVVHAYDGLAEWL